MTASLGEMDGPEAWEENGELEAKFVPGRQPLLSNMLQDLASVGRRGFGLDSSGECASSIRLA